jgi:hypothetical protein
VPNNTPSASWKTRPNILGDVSGLFPEAIEALPVEGRITFSMRLLAAWGGRPGSARANHPAAHAPLRALWP